MNKSGVVTSFFTIGLLFFASFQTCFALDTSKYIPFDEVATDMEAYCLSVFSGTNVEKFDLKILSVVRNIKPGQNMILVLGTDERFEHSSAVHGCSGSPVYIDGRLAGALAAGWDGSLDSLYLVRPIEEMLDVGSVPTPACSNDLTANQFDFSQPLNLENYYAQSMNFRRNNRSDLQMDLPLSCSLPSEVVKSFENDFNNMGIKPVAAGAILPSAAFPQADKFETGGVLSLVLCGGDISMAATGTVTEIVDDQIFGFGHQFRGDGQTALPLAAGVVHTVIASRVSSFKLSSPGPILGTLEFDQSAAIRGTIAKMPPTIPLHIQVDACNDTQIRNYACYLGIDRSLTPMVLQAAVSGAAQMQGILPREHTVRYSGQINLAGDQPIMLDNISSGRKLSDIGMELMSATSMLLNNPFEPIEIDAININLKTEPVDTTASVWAVNLDRTEVKAGQTITATVALRSFRNAEETVTIDFTVPETLRPGNYKMQILGPIEYQSFASKMAPHKFRATNAASLKSGLSRIFKYRRDRLYAVMQIDSSGLVIREHELGQLPPSKMLLMQDPKRLLPIAPYRDWAENHITLDKIVSGTAEIGFAVTN